MKKSKSKQIEERQECLKLAVENVQQVLYLEQARFNAMSDYQSRNKGHQAVMNIMTLETCRDQLNVVLKEVKNI